jgi:prepilin-type N-terminal cleavage/methylation domain-containing protein
MVFQSHIKGRSPDARRERGFTLLEVMMVTLISSFVFAGVLSAYIFLGRGLMRQGFEFDLESHSRVTIHDFTDDISGAQNFDCPAWNPSSVYANPTPSQFTVDILIPVAPTESVPSPPPVLGSATYSYSAGSPGTVTLVRRTPISRALLLMPAWPTQDMGQPDAPLTILTGVNAFTFKYLDATGNYVNEPDPSVDSVVRPLAVKQVGISFSTTAPLTFNPAAAILHGSQALVVMKNKAYITDPNDP